MKSKYVIIISLLFLFTFCFYVESNAKDKHEDIIKLKEVYLKVVDKKYIGTSNIGYTSFSFTKNSLVINTGREYAILPLKNIKELDKTKSSYDIFKPGANSNVSSIIPCDNCMFEQDKNNLIVIDDSSCESDNNSNSQIQLSLLDDNGYINKHTIKYIPCVVQESINGRLHNYSLMSFPEIFLYHPYNSDIYYQSSFPLRHNISGSSFLIITEDKILLKGEYSFPADYSIYTGAPFCMSPDRTKFAMVDDEYNKIRLYTFDNKSIKTNVLTDIQAKSNDDLFLNDNGYLHVVRYGFFKTTSEVYKINDFSKPDGYTYAGKNSVIYYISNRGFNTYHKLLDNTLYQIYVTTQVYYGGAYHDYVDRAYPDEYVISPDMKMAIGIECGIDDGCDMYLYSLEPVDANVKGVENQKK